MKKIIAVLILLSTIFSGIPKSAEENPYLDMARMGCWFWTSAEFEPDGYKEFIDLVTNHSNYKHLTASIRAPLVEVTDESVIQQINKAAVYAQAKGIGLVFDLDVRLARYAFWKKYPDEMQKVLLLQEAELAQSGKTTVRIDAIDIGDHYTYGTVRYIPLHGKLSRAFAYKMSDDQIDAKTLKDITHLCSIVEEKHKDVIVEIPQIKKMQGYTICVIAEFAHFTPAVFASHLDEFQHEIIAKYKNVPLTGGKKDEWGFPGYSKGVGKRNFYWYSSFRAELYKKLSHSRDLVHDCLLMYKGIAGQEQQRHAAINTFMEMSRKRNGEIEQNFYQSVKSVFGKNAIVATHPTWIAYPAEREIMKNGLDWWVAKRDVPQTDESTPYCVRTALAKKWNSPFWVNMYYKDNFPAYNHEIWRSALSGGFVNFHPIYPSGSFPGKLRDNELLKGNLMKANARLFLLNKIVTAPVDCPVAVIFGHASTMNWAGPNFGDTGIKLANAIWRTGYYTDFIPTSEIYNGSLKMLEDGIIQYGSQTYKAAVFYYPEFERKEFADFFQKSKSSQTKLYHIGEWTRDFSGALLTDGIGLPKDMISCETMENCVAKVTETLQLDKIEPAFPYSSDIYQFDNDHSKYPRAGHIKYLDGTHAFLSGENDVMGDPHFKSVKIQGQEVEFDVVGLAAVRFDKQGNIAALAAGGLKSFKAGDLKLELTKRLDFALWKNAAGQWCGYLLGVEGEAPTELLQLTNNWERESFPVSYK